MGLKFEKIQPVQFGDIVAMPYVDEETKLRLQNINFSTLEGRADAIDLMVSCFKEKKDEIREFMKGMGVYELNQLQAYLMGGQVLLDKLDKQFDKMMDRSFNNE